MAAPQRPFLPSRSGHRPSQPSDQVVAGGSLSHHAALPVDRDSKSPLLREGALRLPRVPACWVPHSCLVGAHATGASTEGPLRWPQSTQSCTGQPVPWLPPTTPARAQNNAPERRPSPSWPQRRTAPTRALANGKHAWRGAAGTTPRTVRGIPWLPPKCWDYSWSMRPIRWIIGTSLLGLGAALLVTRRELEEERQAHQETVLALETIKQVATPRNDS